MIVASRDRGIGKLWVTDTSLRAAHNGEIGETPEQSEAPRRGAAVGREHVLAVKKVI